MSKVKPSEEFPSFSPGDFQVAFKSELFSVETTTFKMMENTFFATYWKPTEAPQGLIFICHGYGEYFSPSYDGVAKRMAETGFLVFGHDHVGHGRSTGQRVQVQSLDDYVIPVLSHCKKVRNDYQNELPLFIIGHSMGGLITLYSVLAEPNLFKAVILNGPLVKLAPEIATPLKKILARIAKGILPSFALGNLDASAITRVEEVVKRVENDPLNWHGGFRAQLSYVLMESTDNFENGDLLEDIKNPILILQGEKDKLVNPEGAKFCHDKIGSESKKLVQFPDAFHNLFVEEEDVKSEAIKLTCDWILTNL